MGLLGRAGRVVAIVAIGLVWSAGWARADTQRVEAVGNYGIKDSMRSRVIPRDEAIAAAIWEAVSRVALEVIGESGPAVYDADEDANGANGAARAATSGAGEQDEGKALRKALGKDTLPYTRSFRILEDRGEVPVLFAESPDIDVEYVVVVEVIVDVDRVTRSLETAGLIASTRPVGGGEAIRVEILGLSRYAALDAVIEALGGSLGATRVQTVEFTRERQVLVVEGPFGVEALSQRIERFESPVLALEPIAIDSDGRRIRVLARYFGAEVGPDGLDSGSDRESGG